MFLMFVICQILQNSWMAANVDNFQVSTLRLIVVYFLIGAISTIFLLTRTLLVVYMGIQSSTYLFFQLMNSLFRAPMSFYDSTPLGRILSRVSILNNFFLAQNCNGSNSILTLISLSRSPQSNAFDVLVFLCV